MTHLAGVGPIGEAKLLRGLRIGRIDIPHHAGQALYEPGPFNAKGRRAPKLGKKSAERKSGPAAPKLGKKSAERKSGPARRSSVRTQPSARAGLRAEAR